ncbi:MAG: Asp-tRNA(Asn)/Glu-tRNA(Gln) amidotransferase subunit GatB [Chromatiales bacterium]|nr:Asp-tRNA(Asn)/Glu-tRNA(Gln) amidotransferase subunit GatB [Chromatiales bacterium]
MSWETVIGLEVHAQLATRSKIFSGAATAYGAAPNTQACLVDLGYPGVLPVLNAEAVRMAVRFGLAVKATIARRSVFARKNYFYPDLPKGYQISQYELPIVHDGALDIRTADGGHKRVHIVRAHLEEDAGKSLHENFAGLSGIDLNRAGTPLLEIVSGPDLRSAAEAVEYLRRIHQLVRWLGICDGNMQEGSLRCDANVSVRRTGEDRLGTRAEIKNLNSFRFLDRAILFEVERQIDLLESGGTVVQETRLYDPDRDETRAMRGKEEANDYRYFPDPDLLPVELDDDYIESVRAALPELPAELQARFTGEYGLGEDEAAQLGATREQAAYFEALVTELGGEAKLAANWVIGELAATLNRTGTTIADTRVTAQMLARLLRRIADGTVSGSMAKQVFEVLWEEGGDADAIIEARGLRQISDADELARIIDEVIAANPVQAQQYREGKTKVMGFFVGQVMKATGGKANPAQVNQLLKQKL